MNKDTLDQVVAAVKLALSDPTVRGWSQRAIQGHVWHTQPVVASVLNDLRHAQEEARQAFLAATSQWVYHFHSHATQATLARAGVLADTRIHAGSSLDNKDSLDVLCLDAKERLYVILKV